MMNHREDWNDAVTRQVCQQPKTRGLGLTGRWCDIRSRWPCHRSGMMNASTIPLITVGVRIRGQLLEPLH